MKTPAFAGEIEATSMANATLGIPPVPPIVFRPPTCYEAVSPWRRVTMKSAISGQPNFDDDDDDGEIGLGDWLISQPDDDDDDDDDAISVADWVDLRRGDGSELLTAADARKRVATVDSPLISLAEAAAIVGLTPGSLAKRITASGGRRVYALCGRCPGKLPYFDRAKFLAWFASPANKSPKR
jgi:hypothetical protein